MAQEDLVALRAKVVRRATDVEQGGRMKYPDSWGTYIKPGLRRVWYPSWEGLNKGDDEEWVMIVIPTVAASSVLDVEPDYYKELSKAEFREFMEKQNSGAPYEVDDSVVKAIDVRLRAGHRLTRQETEALEPKRKDVKGVREPDTQFEDFFPNANYKNTSGFEE